MPTPSLRADQAKALIGGVSNPNGGVTDLAVMANQMAAGFFSNTATSGLLPRREAVFLSGAFGPASPASPTAIDRPMGDMVLPRRWQYPVGYNLPSAPGATKPIDFRVLEQLADVYDVLRRCIEVRKQEMATMRWEIVPRDADLTKPGAQRPAELDQRIKDLTAFFECPDPINGIEMGDWLKMALEEVFVKDALSVFPHPTWAPGKGANGSSLFALEILDGKTIKPLLDIRGARPLPPNPAYQQFIWGIPRAEMEAQFDSDGLPMADPDAKTFMAPNGEELDGEHPALYYRPYTRRTWSAYGFSNVEQIILNVNLALKRQQFHTAYFTDGTVPAGIIGLPEDFTPTMTMVREFEEGWNQLMSSDMANKHKIKVLPGAAKFIELKSGAYLGTQPIDFDRWLALLTCMGMDVTTMEIGIGPATNTGLGGKGYGDAEENVTERKSLRPLMHYFKSFFNHVLSTWLHSPDLEFQFLHEEAEDELKRAQVDQILIETGQKTPSEGRVERGLKPYDNQLGDAPMVITRQGPVLLEDVNAISKQTAGLTPDGKPLPPAPGLPTASRGGQRGVGRATAAVNPADDPNTDVVDKSAAAIRKEVIADLEKLVAQELGRPTLDEFAIENDLLKATLTLPVQRPPQPVVQVHPTPVTVAAPIVNLPKAEAPIVNVTAPQPVVVPAPVVNVPAPVVQQLDITALVEGIGEKFAQAMGDRGELEIVRDKYDPTKIVGTRRKRK